MTAPAPHHLVSFGNDTQKKLFMSFGLLNQLSGLIGEIHHLHLVHADSGVRDALFAILLVERDSDGTVKKSFDPQDPNFELSIDQGESLIDWVVAHLRDFFLKRLERQLELQTEISQKISQKA